MPNDQPRPNPFKDKNVARQCAIMARECLRKKRESERLRKKELLEAEAELQHLLSEPVAFNRGALDFFNRRLLAAKGAEALNLAKVGEVLERRLRAAMENPATIKPMKTEPSKSNPGIGPEFFQPEPAKSNNAIDALKPS